MSEKLYAYLLRLFPPAFRKRYEGEALQLLRDRLGEERGIFQRLRFSFDLMVDILRALPQAYRNSYAMAPEASMGDQASSEPSFRVLQKQPLRGEALALAGIVSLAVVTAFSFLMTRPVLYRTDVRNRSISPIESVIKRLNEPGVPGTIESMPRATAQIAHSAAAPANGRFPLEKALLQSGKGAAGPESGTAQPSGKSGEANLTTRISTQRVVVPIPAATVSHPQAQVVARGPSSLHVAGAWPLDVGLNLTGNWTVSIDPMSAVANAPRWIALRQANGRLKGMGGPDSSEQYPIVNGRIGEDSVRFELNYGERRYIYDLKVEGDLPQGSLSIVDGNRTRKRRVWLMPAN